MENTGSRLIQTTYVAIDMTFVGMNLLYLSGKFPGNIFFGVFVLVMTALIGIKCQLTALLDNHVRTAFEGGFLSRPICHYPKP
jgi:hypothetical protein